MEPDEGEISERKQIMISNHKIQTALDEIKDISRIDLALYTEKGKPVAATFEPEGDLEGAITSFADSMAESQMLSGYHFFKVIADGEIEYILLTKSQAEDAYMWDALQSARSETLRLPIWSSLTATISCRISCLEICWS